VIRTRARRKSNYASSWKKTSRCDPKPRRRIQLVLERLVIFVIVYSLFQVHAVASTWPSEPRSSHSLDRLTIVVKSHSITSIVAGGPFPVNWDSPPTKRDEATSMFLPKPPSLRHLSPVYQSTTEEPIKSREKATVIDYDILKATQVPGDNFYLQAQHQQPMDRRHSSDDQ
jgi:hypothetical protein